MPSVRDYVALRGATNLAQTKLRLYDAKPLKDGEYSWGAHGNLRKEVYFVNLFHEHGFFKGKRKNNLASLAHTWATFVDNS